MAIASLGRPMSDEYSPFYAGYVGEVLETDPVHVMESQAIATQALIGTIPDDQSLFRYAPGKWSIREIIGHLVDAERIFGYRALRIARGDETPLEGFDENRYVEAAGFDRQAWGTLVEELAVVRRGTLALFRSLDAAAWNRRGVASNARISVRALAFIIPGHERHHLRILRERYGLPAA